MAMTDVCKTSGCVLRWFESNLSHQYNSASSNWLGHVPLEHRMWVRLPQRKLKRSHRLSVRTSGFQPEKASRFNSGWDHLKPHVDILCVLCLQHVSFI